MSKKLIVILILGALVGWTAVPVHPGLTDIRQALYALAESGVVKTSDERYQQGLSWLLKMQDATGAWIVMTRAYQFISAAATNWASLALLEALPG